MSPLVLVLIVSVVVGFLMVVVFRYTSDQKAIGRAKDQLKAHLLAVRLFQDQLPVVMRAYGRIFGGTARYLRLAFMPFLISLLPITFLIIQLDRYLGSTPLRISEPFLVEAKIADAAALDSVELTLPAGLKSSAPAVHVAKDQEVVWRLIAERDGQYDIQLTSAGQTVSKRLVVSPGLARLSAVRLRGQFWQRLLSSGEAALPASSPVQSIAVNYSDREINFGWWAWNWIVLFFVVSLIAGFIFKSALGIQV
jgi:hypothetical protein